MLNNNNNSFRRRLKRFYDLYNPHQLHKIDDILEAYEGEEEQLFQDLISRYGPEPDDEEVDAEESNQNSSVPQTPVMPVSLPPPTAPTGVPNPPIARVAPVVTTQPPPSHRSLSQKDDQRSGWNETVLVERPNNEHRRASPPPLWEPEAEEAGRGEGADEQNRPRSALGSVVVTQQAWQRPQQANASTASLGELFTPSYRSQQQQQNQQQRFPSRGAFERLEWWDDEEEAVAAARSLLRTPQQPPPSAAVTRQVYQSLVASTSAVVYRKDHQSLSADIAKRMIVSASAATHNRGTVPPASSNTNYSVGRVPTLAQRLTAQQQDAARRSDETHLLDVAHGRAQHHPPYSGGTAATSNSAAVVDARLAPIDRTVCLPSTLNIDEVSTYQQLVRRIGANASTTAHSLSPPLRRSSTDDDPSGTAANRGSESGSAYSPSTQPSGGLYFQEAVTASSYGSGPSSHGNHAAISLSSSPLVTQERVVAKDRAALVERLFQMRSQPYRTPRRGAGGAGDEGDPHAGEQTSTTTTTPSLPRRQIEVICVECGFITMADPDTLHVQNHQHHHPHPVRGSENPSQRRSAPLPPRTTTAASLIDERRRGASPGLDDSWHDGEGQQP